MRTVGYLQNYTDRLEGEHGDYYDYLLAANGLFIEAEGKLMGARVPVAGCEVRGLAPLEPRLFMRHGRIPQRFFDLALNYFLADTSRERYVAVTWNEGYHLYAPVQTGEHARVQYETGESVILDLHSHGEMRAWFSTQDNHDEQGLRFYGVIGKLGEIPVVRLRVGVYGYHYPITWGNVFDGLLAGAVESEAEKEVIDDDGLYGEFERQPGDSQNSSRWVRWYRRLRRGRDVPAAG